jgi:hypothetical protein
MPPPIVKTVKRRLRNSFDYVRYWTGEWSGLRGKHFEGHYSIWRQRRLTTIQDEYSPRFFEGKTLLELGAGYGDIGAWFAALGAKVTCLEGRAENVKVIQERYAFMTAMQHDLNQGLPGTELYNIIIHLGVLYHLANPERALRDSCQRCEHLILETEVADSDDPKFVGIVREHAYIYDQALNGTGCRPSPAWVERILTEEGFEFRRLEDGRCNWGLHEYDWPLLNTGRHQNGRRRMWFANKKQATSP